MSPRHSAPARRLNAQLFAIQERNLEGLQARVTRSYLPEFPMSPASFLVAPVARLFRDRAGAVAQIFALALIERSRCRGVSGMVA